MISRTDPMIKSGERAKNFKFNQYNKDVNPLIYDAKIQIFLQFDTKGTPNLCLFYNFGLFGVYFCRSFLRSFGGERPLAERILNFLL